MVTPSPSTEVTGRPAACADIARHVRVWVPSQPVDRTDIVTAPDGPRGAEPGGGGRGPHGLGRSSAPAEGPGAAAERPAEGPGAPDERPAEGPGAADPRAATQRSETRASGSPPGDEDSLDGFQTTMSRVFGRLRLALGVVVTLAMLIPAGGWVLDRLAFTAAGDEVEESLGDEAAIADSLLLVRSVDCLGRSRTGSAFAAEVDGRAMILTNRHVVEGARSTVVQSLDSAQGIQVTSVLEASGADVAVLRIGEAAAPPSLPAGPEARLGQSVRTVGFPGARPAFRQGRVDRVEEGRLLLALEVGAGASGSPVLDDDGAVIGQVFARTREGRGVATPWPRVVDAARTAEPAASCP